MLDTFQFYDICLLVYSELGTYNLCKTFDIKYAYKKKIAIFIPSVILIIKTLGKYYNTK